MYLETERLILRDITQEDFDSWYEILSDPETMKYYPAPYDRAGVQRWVDWTLGNYERYGFGLWALILKETGEFIGDCGVTMQNIHGSQVPEIGYHIHRRFHRKGYGSEAAAKVRDFAFETWDFPALYSYMNSENAASYGVALKNGMRLVDEYTDDAGERLKVYSITREEWQRVRNETQSRTNSHRKNPVT